MDDSAGNMRWAAAESAAALPAAEAKTEWKVSPPSTLIWRELEFSGPYSYCKRCVDVVGTVVLSIVFLPILLLVSLSLYSDGGDILFRHTRVGKNGKPFKVYKFRTMVPNADKVLRDLIADNPALREEWLRDHKLKNDPRVTAVGAFLRRTSLDELPQLWNVLKGEMSLVGPRPIVRDELSRYGRAARYYLSLKPGLTGVWQISGRNDTEYRRRVAMDRYYACTASLTTDLIVLCKTVEVVLRRRGAY
ncbi:MAG TPA: sugar transferase [Nevskia sp.]|nr:sugar transferase [Nevskia sp.]